jgi:VIT1/CCC1 family predicted Fe2+/Mn2+ transporter
MLGLVIAHQSWKSVITILVAGLFLAVLQFYSGLSKNQFQDIRNPIMVVVFVVTLILVYAFNQEEKEKKAKTNKNNS